MKSREHISALLDGELKPRDFELVDAELQSEDGQRAWNTYHRIRNVLRQQEPPELSSTFAEKLAARLDAESVRLSQETAGQQETPELSSSFAKKLAARLDAETVKLTKDTAG